MQMVQDLKPKQLKLKLACLDLGQCTMINQNRKERYNDEEMNSNKKLNRKLKKKNLKI